jgi:hypothetical protein
VKSHILHKGEQLLQTLWVGGLLAIGYLAVPILFHSLDDRRLAGELAGQMFSAMNIVGFVCGGALLLSALMIANGGWLKTRRVQVLLVMLMLVAVGAFVLQPMMQELKATGLIAGSEAASQFGRLHGISSMLYLVNSLLGIYLVMQSRSDEQRV